MISLVKAERICPISISEKKHCMLLIYRSKVLIMYNQKLSMTVRYEINPPKISNDGQELEMFYLKGLKL